MPQERQARGILPFCIVSGACSGRYASWYAREAGPAELKDEDMKWIDKKQQETRKFLKREPNDRGNPRISRKISKRRCGPTSDFKNRGGVAKGASKP